MPETFGQLHTGLAAGIARVTEQRQAQVYSHERALEWQELCQKLSLVGNHEAQLVVGMLLADQPAYDFSQNDLHKQVVELQGNRGGWTSFSPKLASNYCHDSLEPAGLAIQTQRPVKGSGHYMVRSYRFAGESASNLVSVQGLLADWSLRYPQISIQQLCGPSKTAAILPSEYRVGLLAELATSPLGELSVSSIRGLSPNNLYDDEQRTDKVCRDLEAMGILQIDRVEHENDRVLRLKEPVYVDGKARRGGRPLEGLRLETRLLYEFMGQFSVGDTFTRQQALDYVLGRAKQLDPDLDLAVIKRKCGLLFGHTETLPELERDAATHTKTRMRITPAHDEAVKEFIELLLGIEDKDQELLTHGRQRAAEIIHNPADVAALMSKAYDFSGKARSQGKSSQEEAIKALIAEQGAIDVKTLYFTMRDMGYALAKETVRNYIYRLEKEGAVIAEPVRQNDQSRRKILKYSLKQETNV